MKLMIFDGNSILNRAFYGIKPLTTKDGIFTNAVYGFLNILFKFADEDNPDAICVAFDMRAPTFRHKAYQEYKAQRKPMTEELAMQLPLIREALTVLSIPYIECEGYEADDILASVSKMVTDEPGGECIIITGDRDSLQLVNQRVTVKLPLTKMGKTETIVYTPDKIAEDYGVEPSGMIEIKALMGDSSDNIPGVPGIGEKTALDLIQKYKNIDYIYENIESLEVKSGVRDKLTAGKSSAYLSRELVTICSEAPIDFDISGAMRKPIDNASAYKLFTKLEFNSFIKKFGLSESDNTDSQIEFNMSGESGEEVLNEKDGVPQNIEFFNWDGNGLKIKSIGKTYVLKDPSYEFIKLFFENQEIPKHTDDIKSVYVRLMKMGVQLRGDLFDTGLASYLLNPSAVPSYDIPRLKLDLTEAGLDFLYYQVELPLAEQLAAMETYGFSADREKLTAFGETLRAKIDALTESIYAAAGLTFNINSTKQLAEVLYEKLGLKPAKKTKSKSGYSTDADALEELSGQHDIIGLILEYRHTAKLKSTYVDGLLKVIDHNDGRIHSSFHQTVTQTGRISSTEPNLQNIPVRTELGRDMRRIFVPQKDWLLIDADYSQIELRVLSHIADDPVMTDAFNNNMDIHTITSSQVFGIHPEEVTAQMRSRAKAVNFGIVYGIGEFSLSKDLGVSVKEARDYIDGYLDKYTGVRSYMREIVEQAKSMGYVTTLLGRRRYLPELANSNYNIKKFGERAAMNTPIQGTAADIIKIAMVRVYNRLRDEKMRTRLILQVHDELILESPPEEVSTAAEILKYEMENAYKLKVPLTADVKTGKSWYETK